MQTVFPANSDLRAGLLKFMREREKQHPRELQTLLNILSRELQTEISAPGTAARKYELLKAECDRLKRDPDFIKSILHG